MTKTGAFAPKGSVALSPLSDSKIGAFELLNHNIDKNKYITEKDRENEVIKKENENAMTIFESVHIVSPYGEYRKHV